MIEFPATPALNGAAPALIDFGGVMRPSLGGEALKINRMGSRFKIACSLPAMPADVGRVFVARLIAAKREGLRVKFPLLGVDQSGVGSPVVAGAGQAGLYLYMRSATPFAVIREGYWFSIQNAAGRHHLHNVRSGFTATGAGDLVIGLEPMLRVPFADGATVNFAAPMIEGIVDGEEIGWQMSLAHHVGIDFTIEEAS